MANRIRVNLALKLILIIANLCFLVIYVSGWTAPLIQSNKKSIIRRVTYAKYPVEISFHLKGQPLTNETLLDGFRSNDFDADGDWLKDLMSSYFAFKGISNV
jgi:hypothetical protein